MEDLVHGLINVALGRYGDGDEANRSNNSPALEERSRSTWAQVVSSGQDDKEEEEEDGYSTQFGSRKEQNEGRNDGGWESVGHKKQQPHHPSRMPQKVAYSGQEDEEEYGPEKSFNSYSSQLGSRKEKNEGRSDEGWETVEHKKQPHHPSRIPHKVPVDNWHRYKQPPSEQEYINEGHHGMDIKPSREELADLSKACSRLWELDSNRLVPGKDYEVDCGEGKKVYEKEDMASGSLFRWLNDDVFRRPTYGRFCSLLDNYNPNEGYKEVVTPQEKHEQAAFIEEITRTAPIRYLHKYLVCKGIAPEGYEEFKRMMTSLWFDLHGRGGGSSCSSAFEHVFVGEIKGRGENAVSGFHNWVQFYLEEAKGRVDYQGYLFPRRRGRVPDSETQLLTLQFEWNGVLKTLSSTFIGVSPEFEIALYTLCFFVGREDNHVFLGPYAVNIKCHHLGNDRIGSVFPIAES